MTAPACTVFVLPGLGFGARLAEPLAAALGERFRVVGIDLPGHDGAPDAPDASVSALADAALAAIEAEATGGPLLLVGHSMGGKVAGLVARRILTGEANVFGLAGQVLLAPSPPTPEPMGDDKRAEMLGWVADGPISEEHARAFVADNVALSLGDDSERDAVAQVRRMSPLAWRRWLETGSREDVSAEVGTLDLPVVVLAGAEDADLGFDAQPRLLDGVYPRARFVTLADTGHLLPYERPTEVAAEIVRLWESISATAPRVPDDWGRVIASTRTAGEARALLARRALADDPDAESEALNGGQLQTLRALAERLVPQGDGPRIDLALRIDRDLAAGRGDGWRTPDLPDDAAAYRHGLDLIAAVWPAGREDQDALIGRIIDGGGLGGDSDSDSGSDSDGWSDDTLQHWFEDVRNDLARTWLAHPASLARVGYDGFATSGDADVPGYVTLAAGTRDPWEPADLGTLPPDAGPSADPSTAPDTDADAELAPAASADLTPPTDTPAPTAAAGREDAS